MRCSLSWRFAATTRCDVLCRKWHLLSTHRRLSGARRTAIKGHTEVTSLGIFKIRLEARGHAHVLGGLLNVLAHVLWWRLHRAGRLLCNAKARRKHTCARTHARQRRQPLGESTGDEPAMRRPITPRSDRGRRERRRRGPSARNAAINSPISAPLLCVHSPTRVSGTAAHGELHCAALPDRARRAVCVARCAARPHLLSC